MKSSFTLRLSEQRREQEKERAGVTGEVGGLAEERKDYSINVAKLLKAIERAFYLVKISLPLRVRRKR
jgi:uncharacterized protein YhaN